MTANPEVLARAVDVQDVHARTREVCGRLNRANAELVDIVAGLLESGMWAEGGIRSPEHWLMVRAGLTPGRAKDIVTLARRLDELPQTAASLSAGRLSIDQAAVVAQHVPATHSRAANDLAEKATVTQLRRILPRYSTGDDEPGPEADPINEEPQLRMHTRGGRFFLRYEGPESVAVLIEKAIREAKDSLFHGGQRDATLADGLLEVANRSLSTLDASSRMSKYRIYVHIDTEGGWLDRSGRLPKHMLDRLTCEGVVQPIWETEGHPVNVGRAQRIVPRRTRRLVEARDKGCRFPGCTTSGGHLEIHHIQHWRDGGESNTWELVCLCGSHHDAHHRGEFAISGNADEVDRLSFTSRGGWPLLPLAGESPSQEDRILASSRHLRVVEDSGTGPGCPPPDFTGPLGERLLKKWVDLTPNDHPVWQVWPRSLGGDRPDDPDPPGATG